MSLEERARNKKVRSTGTRRYRKRKNMRGHDRYKNKHKREKFW